MPCVSLCPRKHPGGRSPPTSLLFGGASQNRTGSSRICSPVPYHPTHAPCLHRDTPEDVSVERQCSPTPLKPLVQPFGPRTSRRLRLCLGRNCLSNKNPGWCPGSLRSPVMWQSHHHARPPAQVGSYQPLRMILNWQGMLYMSSLIVCYLYTHIIVLSTLFLGSLRCLVDQHQTHQTASRHCGSPLQ